LISFLERQRRVRYRYDDDISEAIVRQVGNLFRARFAVPITGVAPKDEPEG